jgi:hypothetical protein
MPHGVHKNPFLGWNPPAEDSAWLEAEVQRRGGGRGIRTALLNEALADLRAKHSAFVAASPGQPQAAPRRHAVNCKCGVCRPENGDR